MVVRLTGFRVKPVFLMGERSSFLTDDGRGFLETTDRTAQDARAERVVQGLGLDLEPKTVVRKDEHLLSLDAGADVLLLFVHTMHRFGGLVSLADTGLPLILAGEEGAPGDAMDTYQFLSDYDNVSLAFSFEEIRRKVRVLRAANHVRKAKVCLFDAGERSDAGSPWYRNPTVSGWLNTHRIDLADFEERYGKIDPGRAEKLAENWLSEAELREPSAGDVARVAALYVAMKDVIEQMKADAAYVLWCGQFSKLVGGKMCFAVAKLNDDGYLTGCWRGENLVPMLILSALTEKPVFFGEVHTYREGVLALRHCAVPCSMSSSTPILKRWRDRQGTVTAYCDMPRGEVTVACSGSDGMAVAVRGEIVDTKDLGGDNCRTTVRVRIQDRNALRKFRSREVAMAYGDCVEEVKEVANELAPAAI